MEPQLFYVGVKALIVRDGRVLLLNRYKPRGGSHWDLPGGRIGADEAVEMALIRELDEELPDIEVLSIGIPAFAYRLPKDLPDGHGLFLVYVRVNARLPNDLTTPDHSEHRWLNSREVRELPDTPELRFEPGCRTAALRALEDAS